MQVKRMTLQIGLLAAVLSVGCGAEEVRPGAVNRSICGVDLVLDPATADAGTVEVAGHDTAEIVALETLEAEMGWDAARICAAIHGSVLTVHPTFWQRFDLKGTPSWLSGLSWVLTSSVELAATGWDHETPLKWSGGSYCHEMAHLGEWIVWGMVEYDHVNWGPLGIQAAIDKCKAQIAAEGY